jgi:ElaB/YqjD/DUF883 family membrane-anchored ribosome-binding protein
MDNEPEVIRQQMEDTRTALQDKLETLEQHVTQTVQGAADAATETVQSVKDAVQETVATVKDTVQDTVVSVKRTFDLNAHVQKHPWAMFVGAVAAGYVATRLLAPSRPGDTATAPAETPPAPAVIGISTPAPASSKHRNGKHHHDAAREKPGLLAAASKRYGEELTKLQSLAVGMLGAVVREVLTSAAAPPVAEQITEILDGVTEKMGGKPIRGPLFQTPPAAPKGKPDEYQFETKVARPMGTA